MGQCYSHELNSLLQDEKPPSLVRLFLTHMLHFFTVAMALYFIAEVYSKVSRDSLITETMKCKYCRKSISRKVGDEAVHSRFICV